MRDERAQQKYYFPNEAPRVTITLVIINVLLYLLETRVMKGNAWELFGTSWDTVFTGEWYKLFTAMFTHASLAHLGSNMIALYGAGMYLEEKFGKGRFLIYYLLSGLFGEFLGCMFSAYAFGRTYLTIGASGAVFGLFGMLIVLSLRRQMFRIPFLRIVLFIALSVTDALTETGIDIWGHAGGFITGIVIGLIYSFTVGKRSVEG